MFRALFNILLLRLVRVDAQNLVDVIGSRMHGLNPSQAASLANAPDDFLPTFNRTEPISGYVMDGAEQIALTGGHHRTAEVSSRVNSAQLSPTDRILILLHHR